MDLDPGEGVPWTAVLDAAREVRARFEDAGLAGFVKTSGGKGLHVVAPLKPTDAAGWDEVKGFAAAMARSMAAEDPDRYVATITKAKRTGRILLDYLRNGRNNTAIVAYGAAPARRPGVDAARLGRARPRDRPGALHRRERARAGRPIPRPLGRLPRLGGAAADGQALISSDAGRKRARRRRFRSCSFPCPCRPRRCASARP